MIVHAYLGEVTHQLKSGRTRRFRPDGPVRLSTASTYSSKMASEDAERLGGGGYAARLFVGLKVGQETRWTVEDVIKIVWRVRKGQGQPADASILTQQGIYEDRSGERVVEPSVQVIIIDLVGTPKEKFVADMTALGEALRKELEQETVILEIQQKGVVQDVYSVT